MRPNIVASALHQIVSFLPFSWSPKPILSHHISERKRMRSHVTTILMKIAAKLVFLFSVYRTLARARTHTHTTCDKNVKWKSESSLQDVKTYSCRAEKTSQLNGKCVYALKFQVKKRIWKNLSSKLKVNLLLNVC